MNKEQFEDNDYLRYRALYQQPLWRHQPRRQHELTADELLDADEIDGSEAGFLRGYEIP